MPKDLPDKHIALSIQTLDKLDEGIVAATVNDLIAKAIDDITERPGDDRERCVSLDIKLQPITASSGALQGVTLSFDIKHRLPSQRTKAYGLDLIDHMALFRPAALAPPQLDVVQHIDELRKADASK